MANYKGHIAGGIGVGAIYTLALSKAPVERYAEAANVLHDWQALTAIFGRARIPPPRRSNRRKLHNATKRN